MTTDPSVPAAGPAPGGRRCRDRPTARRDGDLRPTDVVGSFFVCGIAFLIAAAIAGLIETTSPWSWGSWLALHLAFVGGISQLVLGASQFFVGAFLATDPPPRRLVRAELLLWNLGAIALAITVPGAAGAGIWLAVGCLVGALGLWATSIAVMWRRSLRRSIWAIGWYCSGALFLGFGIIAGSLLAHGVLWSHGDLLGAHMSLNVAGWFGGAIVGTMHTFYPSLTQTQLRYPRLQGLTFTVWTAGVVALAVGYAWGLGPLAIIGWLMLCLGAVGLLANVTACLLDASGPLSLAARAVGAAQPFLLAGLLVAAFSAVENGPEQALTGTSRAAVGTLLVAGWIGLTVLGSLLHLLAVVIRVRGGFAATMPVARPRLDGTVVALAMAAITVLALAQGAGLDGLHDPARLLLLAVYGVLGARVAQLAGRVVARARPSI